jgi:hypothetical protein
MGWQEANEKWGAFQSSPIGGTMLGAINSIGGHLYDQWNINQQMDNQMELMDYQTENQLQLMQQQFYNQTGLNVQGHELQFQMWLKTNYPAQVEQMKKAGLNPALMYKGAGPGGTTGSQGGGAAAGGSAGLGMAPKAPGFELYGAQANLMKEQAKDLKSQRDKRNGVDTELQQEAITEKRLQNDLLNIKKEYNEKGYIDGNYFATLMNMLGKDPINNPEDKEWIMNRVYGYFGAKLGAEILKAGGLALGAWTGAKGVGAKGRKGKKGFTGKKTGNQTYEWEHKRMDIGMPGKRKGFTDWKRDPSGKTPVRGATHTIWD